MCHLAPLHAECRSYAQKLTQNRAYAEDLVQEALKRYLANDSIINNRKGYIKRTIHNLYINDLREEKRHRIFVSHSLTEDAVSKPVFSIETEGEVDQLFSLMQNILTPLEMAVFIMKKGFEKEYEWIRQVFGISYENSRQLVHRAKTKLRVSRQSNVYRGGSHLYNIFLRASQSGDLVPLINALKEEIAVVNN